MRVVIATVQVPFIHGGAEALTEGLRDAIVQAGHSADIVSLPFRFFPESEILRSMQLWESEDYTELNLYEPDLVICLKFPAFYLKHPAKRAWILHQFRNAYDLREAGDKAVLSDNACHLIQEKDSFYFNQCQYRFALSYTVADRLWRYNHLKAEPLYHPPPNASKFYSSPPQPYIFAPSRLETLKRIDLLIEAMRHVKSSIWAIIAGTGGQYLRLKEKIERYNLTDRVRLVGQISSQELRAFYANCLAVFFGPRDEDYGYVTLEAMLAAKPVITCKDSGGPVEFISDEIEGLVVDSDPQLIAEAIDRLANNRSWSITLGKNGQMKYDALALSWQNVVSALLA